MRRRFLPLAAAFSMMAAASEDQTAAAGGRDEGPTPNGETLGPDQQSRTARAAEPPSAGPGLSPRTLPAEG